MDKSYNTDEVKFTYTGTDPDGLSSGEPLKILNQPQFKWSWTLGSSFNNTITFNQETAPNRFQRWLMTKLLGIYWRPYEGS